MILVVYTKVSTQLIESILFIFFAFGIEKGANIIVWFDTLSAPLILFLLESDIFYNSTRVKVSNFNKVIVLRMLVLTLGPKAHHSSFDDD